VLNKCADTSHKAAIYNNNPGLQARYIAHEAQKIDIRDCPPDFRQAFQAHIFAWQQSAAALQNNTAGAAVMEGALAGATGDSRFIGQANQDAAIAVQQINETYFVVTEIAQRYGARVPTSVVGQ